MELKAYIDDLTSHVNATEAAHQRQMEKNKDYIDEIAALKEKLKQSESQLTHLDALQRDVENLKANLEELDMLREENNRLKNDVQSLTSMVSHLSNSCTCFRSHMVS